MAALCRNPCAVISPTPIALHAALNRKLKALFENGSPLYPANTKLRTRKVDPSGSQNPPRFKALLNILPLEERRTQGAGNRHILEDACLFPNPQVYGFFSYCRAISPFELNQLIKSASSLKERGELSGT